MTKAVVVKHFPPGSASATSTGFLGGDGICEQTGPSSSLAFFFDPEDSDPQFLKVGTTTWNDSPNCEGKGESSTGIEPRICNGRPCYVKVDIDLKDVVSIRAVKGKTCKDVAGMSLKQIAQTTETFTSEMFVSSKWFLSDYLVGSCDLFGFGLNVTELQAGKLFLHFNQDYSLGVSPGPLESCIANVSRTTQCLDTEYSKEAGYILIAGPYTDLIRPESKPTFLFRAPEPEGVAVASIIIPIVVLAAVFVLSGGLYLFFRRRKQTPENHVLATL